MLAVVFGASGSGKSTHAALVADLLPDVAVHDFDEIGGSGPWDNEWRRRATAGWIEQARTAPADTMLFGGVAGEVLATPAATELDGLAFCLLDCTDVERVRRLRERPGLSAHELWDHVAWGVWLRFHASDPRWWLGPLRRRDDALAWSRWESWRAGDRRWRIDRVDSSAGPPAKTAAALAAWFRDRQRARDAGTLPLSGRWWDD